MSLRIEAFEAPQTGARWALPKIGGKTIDFDLALEMGRDKPYTRHVLVTNEKAGKAYYDGSLRWDAVLLIKENVDATLALTYLTNVPKGALCYIDGDIHDALLAKILSLSKSHSLTVLWACTNATIGKHDIDGIFFPRMYPETKESQEIVEILRAKMGTVEIGSILKELRASKAVLQWSKWGETSNVGSLYWNYEGSEKRLDVDLMKKAILGFIS
jgi:hypothetical protein